MTDDRFFNECDELSLDEIYYKRGCRKNYIAGLTDALKIIEGMVEDNSAIQAWNFVAKRSAAAILHKIKDCEK